MNYASKNIENTSRRAVDLLLLHLKTHGATSTSALAKVLDVSSEAVRQHLTRLIEQGMIVGERSSTGVGRPKQLWRLTEAGHARFPDTHAQLTVQIIRIIDETLGQEGMQLIVERRAEKQLAEYRAQLASSVTLGDRLTKLADLRDAEGYMARVERDGADFLLIEDHCPICAAAMQCQGFCASELSQFQLLMDGLGQVTREEHIVHGARRCVYRVQAASEPRAVGA